MLNDRLAGQIMGMIARLELEVERGSIVPVSEAGRGPVRFLTIEDFYKNSQYTLVPEYEKFLADHGYAPRNEPITANEGGHIKRTVAILTDQIQEVTLALNNPHDIQLLETIGEYNAMQVALKRKLEHEGIPFVPGPNSAEYNCPHYQEYREALKVPQDKAELKWSKLMEELGAMCAEVNEIVEEEWQAENRRGGGY